MYPPIFAICDAAPPVTALLGTDPVKLFPFGNAEDEKGRPPSKPYAVWQTITGIPENYLGQVPDADSYSLQVDVYADTVSSARAVAEALRDAIEPHAYITAWRGESRDPETKSYRFSFDVDWIVQR